MPLRLISEAPLFPELPTIFSPEDEVLSISQKKSEIAFHRRFFLPRSLLKKVFYEAVLKFYFLTPPLFIDAPRDDTAGDKRPTYFFCFSFVLFAFGILSRSLLPQ